jgi:hypothetical protein
MAIDAVAIMIMREQAERINRMERIGFIPLYFKEAIFWPSL